MKTIIDEFRLCDAKAVSELVVRAFRSRLFPTDSPDGRLVFEQMCSPAKLVFRITATPDAQCRIARRNDEIVGMIETRSIQNGLFRRR